MENAFVDRGDRATREEITQLLRERFALSPGDILTPEFFGGLRDGVSSSARDYAAAVVDLVDTVGAIPEVDARETTITEDGYVWASTQNYDEKGLALVVLDDVEDIARPRTQETLEQLANRLSSVLDEASNHAGKSQKQALLRLIKVLETIGTVDTHSHLQVRVARSRGKITLSRNYAGMDAHLLFIPEKILPTSLDEERVLSGFDQVLFREPLPKDEGVRINVTFPPELVGMMEDVLDEINDDIAESIGPSMSKAQLIRMSISAFLAKPDALEATDTSNQEILASTEGSMVESSVNIAKEDYAQLYDYVDEHPELGERPITRMAVGAITGLLADRLGRSPWRPAVTPIKDEAGLWAEVAQDSSLSDVNL